MKFETINFELKENGIGILTLNRPDKHYYLSLAKISLKL